MKKNPKRNLLNEIANGGQNKFDTAVK